MPVFEIVTTVSLWELVKHASSWVRNLQNAKDERKKESKAALRKVILAARKTGMYTSKLAKGGDRSLVTEEELSLLWTELSFDLDDLGLDKLAKRCRIKGKHWSDPDDSDKDYLKKADVGLERMEQLANKLLREIGN